MTSVVASRMGEWEAGVNVCGVERDGRDKSGPYGFSRNELRLLAPLAVHERTRDAIKRVVSMKGEYI